MIACSFGEYMGHRWTEAFIGWALLASVGGPALLVLWLRDRRRHRG